MEDPESFIREFIDGCTIALKVIPRSSRDQVVGVEQGTLKIKLQAPPMEDAANEAALDFLAALFKKPKKSITFVSGRQSRRKVVRINGLKTAEALKALNSKQ